MSVHTLVVDHNLVAIHMQVAAAAISKVGPSVHTVVLHFDLEPCFHMYLERNSFVIPG